MAVPRRAAIRILRATALMVVLLMIGAPRVSLAQVEPDGDRQAPTPFEAEERCAQEPLESPDLVFQNQAIVARVRVVAEELDEIFASIDDATGGRWRAARLGSAYGYDDDSTFVWITTSYGCTLETLNVDETPGLESGRVYGPATRVTVGTYGEHVDAEGNVDQPLRWTQLLRVFPTAEQAARANAVSARTPGQITAYHGDISIAVDHDHGYTNEHAMRIQLRVREPSSRFRWGIRAVLPVDEVPLSASICGDSAEGDQPAQIVANLDRSGAFDRGYLWSDQYQEQIFEDGIDDFEFYYLRPRALRFGTDWRIHTLPDDPWLQLRYNQRGAVRYVDPPAAQSLW